jgi:hypothetical protein
MLIVNDIHIVLHARRFKRIWYVSFGSTDDEEFEIAAETCGASNMVSRNRDISFGLSSKSAEKHDDGQVKGSIGRNENFEL